MRLLLVEDDPSAARFIAKGLREASYAVDVAPDGEMAAQSCAENDYDAIVLDLMIPKKDGLTLCRELRASGADVPILMLTARDAIESRVEGLDAGADGYLTKPFDFRELLARLRALTRRERRPVAAGRLTLRHLTIDIPSRRAWRHGVEVALTTREFALLEFLMRHAGDAVTRTQLLEHVWDVNYGGVSNVVDVYVGYVRRKLTAAGSGATIRTLRGVGYVLEAPS